MKCSLWCWRPAVLLCLGLINCGEAQVLTETPAGPLYRVVGSPLLLSCNVSGFERKNSRKEFEFRMRKPARPDYDMNILSTQDRMFGFTVFSDRVRNGDINVTYLSPNSVVFEIKRLQKDDEGEYECSVVNKESTYRGTYNSVTAVKVLDNSLSVSSSEKKALTFTEGQSLSLTCQASSNTFQHTHLSFAWLLLVDGEARPHTVMSLDRDFALQAGGGFDQRYKQGLVRLDKLGDATYKLHVAELQLSDRGKIYCQAQEWIQDPDRSWYCITQKSSGEIALEVNAKVVETETSPLGVTVSTHENVLLEGQKLSLTCCIDTPKVEGKFFSIAWFKDGVMLAQIGPTGVLTVGSEYSGREKDGELRAARTSSRDYGLTMQPVRTSDNGVYMCRAWPQNRDPDGTFSRGAAQDSGNQSISISKTESGISVEMLNSSTINEGDRLTLSCKVTGVTGQLSVTWQHKPSTSSGEGFTNVISLSQEGVTAKGEQFDGRKVRAERPATNDFTLELEEVTTSDAGVYQCAVSEWKDNSKISSQSQSAAVAVKPVGELVKVSLVSRENRVTVGGDVALLCRVSGPRMPLTVSWNFQRADKTLDTIVTLYSDGSISWSANQNRYQVKIEKAENRVLHYLLINSATFREAGSYQCSVTFHLHGVHSKALLSNQLAVVVQNPVYDLRLENKDQQLTVMEGADVELMCSINSQMPTTHSFYKLSWLYTRTTPSINNVSLVELDHRGLLRFPENPALQDLQERLRLSRPTQSSFHLGIQRVHREDGGAYRCHVEQYKLDPEGKWQPEVGARAPPVSLTVNVEGSNLSVEAKELELNVTGDVSVPCNIQTQSSNVSAFQVTWFWQKRGEKEQAIFTSYRNSTLRDGSGGALRLAFYRPLSNQFELTVLTPRPENSGLYFCEVEEWLPSLSGGWRRVAVERSKHLTVNVQTQGAASFASQCPTWFGIAAAVFVGALLVIAVLGVKMCRSGASGGRKAAPSLWAETLPLEAKPGAE